MKTILKKRKKMFLILKEKILILFEKIILLIFSIV